MRFLFSLLLLLSSLQLAVLPTLGQTAVTFTAGGTSTLTLLTNTAGTVATTTTTFTNIADATLLYDPVTNGGELVLVDGIAGYVTTTGVPIFSNQSFTAPLSSTAAPTATSIAFTSTTTKIVGTFAARAGEAAALVTPTGGTSTFYLQCGGHQGTDVTQSLNSYFGNVLSDCEASATTSGTAWTAVLSNNPLVQRFDMGASLVTNTTNTYLVMTGGSNPTSFVSNDVIAVGLAASGTTAVVSLQTTSAPWPARAGHAQSTFFNVAIISGGFIASPNVPVSDFTPIATNDVWLTQNAGVTWQYAIVAAPWAARFYHNQVTTNAAIYILNGISMSAGSITLYNDLWSSTNFGQTWTNVIASGAVASPVYLAAAVGVSLTSVASSYIVVTGGTSGNSQKGFMSGTYVSSKVDSAANAVTLGSASSQPTITFVNGQSTVIGGVGNQPAGSASTLSASTSGYTTKIPAYAIALIAVFGALILAAFLAGLGYYLGRSKGGSYQKVPAVTSGGTSPRNVNYNSSNGYNSNNNGYTGGATNAYGSANSYGSKGTTAYPEGSEMIPGARQNGGYNSNSGQNSAQMDFSNNFRPSEMQQGMQFNSNPVVSGGVPAGQYRSNGAGGYLTTPGGMPMGGGGGMGGGYGGPSAAYNSYPSSYGSPRSFQGYY